MSDDDDDEKLAASDPPGLGLGEYGQRFADADFLA